MTAGRAPARERQSRETESAEGLGWGGGGGWGWGVGGCCLSIAYSCSNCIRPSVILLYISFTLWYMHSPKSTRGAQLRQAMPEPDQGKRPFLHKREPCVATCRLSTGYSTQPHRRGRARVARVTFSSSDSGHPATTASSSSRNACHDFLPRGSAACSLPLQNMCPHGTTRALTCLQNAVDLS